MHTESEATIYRCHRFETLLEGAWRARVEEVTTVLDAASLIPILAPFFLLSHHLLSPATPFQSLPISLRLLIPNATILPSCRHSTIDT